MAVLKVSSHSNPSATAGALANTIRSQGKAEIQVIGPKAVNQAIKAIAIARGYIAPSGIDLITVPSFVEVEIEGQERTAIKLEVRPRNPISNLKLASAQAQAQAPSPSSEPEAKAAGGGEAGPNFEKTTDVTL